MPDDNVSLGGPQLVFAPDTSATETAADSFNPMTAVRHAAEQTTPTSFAGLGSALPSKSTSTINSSPVSSAEPVNSTDVISSTLDLLHQAEQALAAEMHRINTQETSTLDEIKTLVDKAKSIEQREDQLNQFIKRIEERRNQITTDPSSAAAIAQESWLKALAEDYQAPTPRITHPPVQVQSAVIATPVLAKPTEPLQPPAAPLRSISPVQPSVPVEPVVTTPAPSIAPISVTAQPPTAAEQKIVMAVKAVEPPPRQVFLDATTHVYRSHDGNGVLMQHGKDTMHVSDAELIQAGLFVEDLAELKTAPDA